MCHAGVKPYRLRAWGASALIDHAGKEIRLATRKHLLLLVILALDEQKEWSRAELAALIWPEAEPTEARASLRTALKSLRKVLPPQALISDSEANLALNPALVEVEPPQSLDPEEFMRGSVHPWVTEHRKKLTDLAVTQSVVQARRLYELGRTKEALIELKKASNIDPDDPRAQSLKSHIQGNPAPPQTNQIHPLLAAGRFLLASDPEQAIVLLASTQKHWGAISITESVEIHNQALAGWPEDSLARRRVEAMAAFLNVVNGHSTINEDRLRLALDREVKDRDYDNAATIASALSIAAQQLGQMEKALKFAKVRATMLERSHRPEAGARGAFQLANMERHCANYQAAKTRNLEAMKQFDFLGSDDDYAFANLTASTDAIWFGEFDRAAEHIQRATNHFAQTNNQRLKPWGDMARAFLLESTGQLDEARRILLLLRDQGLDRAGQTFRAGVEDHLLRVDAKQSDWSESTRDWAYAKLVRHKFGLVTTTFERELAREAKLLLRDRVGIDHMRSYLHKPSALA